MTMHNIFSLTPFTQGWRLLRDYWAMKKWPDLSTIFQRVPSNRQDLLMISSSDLHGRHGLCKVLTQSITIFQWWPREAISQWTNTPWTLNKRQIFPLRRRDGWEINDCMRISHISGFALPLRDCLRIGPIFDCSMVALWSPFCVTGPLKIILFWFD